MDETSLVLRVCRADGTSKNGFQWPDTVGSEVVAPDWSATADWGSGLHGWLYGQGDHSCVSYWEQSDARWYVLEVRNDSLIMLGGKCKFPRATVRFIGSMTEAAAYIALHEPKSASVAIIGHIIQVEAKGIATVGALGTATAGNDGTATAGNDGTATAGYGGTATAGNRGTATAGNDGTATAGNRGEIRIRYWDAAKSRYRTVVGYIGENGLKPNVKYRLNASHEFVEA